METKNNRPVYSVIIPTYNEASKPEDMEQHLQAITEYFGRLGQPYEVIIALDGPTDQTPQLVKKHAENFPHIKILKREKNMGKGYTLREGLLAADGQIRLFTDMDGATPIEMFDRFLPKFSAGADIVIGSRDHAQAEIKKHQPKWKEWAGDLGNLMIQVFIGLRGMKDTQCGFKAFTEQAVKDIFPRTKVNRWGIDFELLFIGKKLDYQIEEVPVEWHDKGISTVGIKGYFITLRELIKVKINYWLGVYQLRKKIVERQDRARQSKLGEEKEKKEEKKEV